MGIARDYDAYEKLKNNRNQDVKEDNASDKFHQAQNEIIRLLEKLDINNETEIENLYLSVSQLTTAATYLIAEEKKKNDNRSFEEIRGGVSTEDVANKLITIFKNQPNNENLHKIIAIDKKYLPAKQAWSALHSRMQLVTETIQRENIKASLVKIAPAYQKHLEEKLKSYGIEINDAIDTKNFHPKIIKTINRCNAIKKLNDIAQNKPIQPNMIKDAQNHVQECLNNNPDWSERPFLQKLTDILTLGMKPLYRAYFSKEKEMQEDLENTFSSPKPK